MKPTTRDTLKAGGATAGLGCGAYLLILLAIAAATGLGAFIWWLTVATSGVKGAGDVHKDQNSARNREYWSQTFNAEYQQVQADIENLATLKDAAAGPGATQQDRQNYLGAQLNCRTDVAKYNADTQSALGAPWLPAGLPSSINPTTTCGS